MLARLVLLALARFAFQNSERSAFRTPVRALLAKEMPPLAVSLFAVPALRSNLLQAEALQRAPTGLA